MRKIRVIGVLCAVLVSVLFLVSCKTNKSVTLSGKVLGEEKYKSGSLTAQANTSLFYVDKAIRRACARARFEKKKHEFRTSSCEYEYQDVANLITVSITATVVEKSEENNVTVKVRVGAWGDLDASISIMTAIDEELNLLMNSKPDLL